MSRSVARVFAYWRTGLSGPVIVRQAGTAVNYFGTGLILPFEIIYQAGRAITINPTAPRGPPVTSRIGYYSDDDFDDDEDPDEL